MSFNLILHLVVIPLCFGVFGFALIFWRRVKRSRGAVSERWKFFTFSLFFLGLSEIIDFYTPICKQTTGGVNFYSEMMELFGLALLFLSLSSFLRYRAQEKAEG